MFLRQGFHREVDAHCCYFRGRKLQAHVKSHRIERKVPSALEHVLPLLVVINPFELEVKKVLHHVSQLYDGSERLLHVEVETHGVKQRPLDHEDPVLHDRKGVHVLHDLPSQVRKLPEAVRIHHLDHKFQRTRALFYFSRQKQARRCHLKPVVDLEGLDSVEPVVVENSRIKHVHWELELLPYSLNELSAKRLEFLHRFDVEANLVSRVPSFQRRARSLELLPRPVLNLAKQTHSVTPSCRLRLLKICAGNKRKKERKKKFPFLFLCFVYSFSEKLGGRERVDKQTNESEESPNGQPLDLSLSLSQVC
mmetsp:Transcript_8780/g.16287  ORF Transcript_8780/g.16287 Transcript_8780/m.16287 type:complete len:308 (-) Transcript_8780:14-937(-)